MRLVDTVTLATHPVCSTCIEMNAEADEVMAYLTKYADEELRYFQVNDDETKNHHWSIPISWIHESDARFCM